MPELIWDGKYQDGKRAAPVRIELPFQTVETVNESAQDRQRSLELFASGRDAEWRNRLIWGDKKYILPSLLPEFAGKVDLIYIDPPFDTGANFSFTATIPNHPDSPDDETPTFTKEPSILEQKAYRDTWGVSTEDRQRGVTHADRYIKWFYETVVFLHELLAEDGSLYVHCDWRMEAYIRNVLEELFSRDNFMNTLIWQRDSAAKGAKKHARQWSREGDSIIFFGKSQKTKFTTIYKQELTETQLREYIYEEPDGRKFKKVTLGDYSEESIQSFRKQNLIYRTNSGREYKKYYLDEAEFAVGSIWTDIVNLSKGQHEQLGYPTQKPEALLERIVNASSKEGDLVADFFCGSGTTLAVAEKLGRRWIGCDLSRFAIHTTRKRLLDIPKVRPFAIQNLGKYERQAWQGAEFPNPEDQRAREAAYRNFILDLYRASPITGRTWLHGTKNGRFVHVGAVDAPVTLADVKAVAAETWKAAGSEAGSGKAAADILGWEFAFELNETARDVTAQARVDIVFRKIPREVLEKKAIEQGDIRFFELAALKATLKQKKREATLELADFVVPPDDVPEDVRTAIKHWSQWIDYWAVDWDYKGDTFHNQWQSYRTRKDPRIETKCSHTYDAPGSYIVVAKVIDILGNDTTKTIAIEVR